MSHALDNPVARLALVVTIMGACAVLALAIRFVGAGALVLVPLLLAVPLVLGRPLLALALVIIPVVAFEDGLGWLSIQGRFYAEVVPGVLPTDLLVFALALAAMIDPRVKARGLRLPGPLTIPLVALGFAVLVGLVVGKLAGGSSALLLSFGLRLVLLAIIPLLVVNVLDGSNARWALAVFGILAAGKALLGLAAVAGGGGSALSEDGAAVTYLAPTANFLMMVFLLGVAAALIMRVRLPTWAYVAAPVVALSLTLSYRRSFWIATVLALLLVFVFASGRTGRRPLVLVLIGLAVGVGMAFTIGDRQAVGRDQASGPVAQRLQSINPQKIRANKNDRYRLAERANVWEEIRRAPILGLGIGVGWTAREPLPFEFSFGRQYVHFVALWYWLKLGLAGVVAYAWLLTAALVCAWRVSRRHPDPLIRVGAIALGCGLVGLAVAELTAAFTGVEYRLTVTVATCLGWLAVVHGALPRHRVRETGASTINLYGASTRPVVD